MYMYESWAVSFNCEKQSSLTLEFKKLTTKQRKNSLACGLDAAFLPNFFSSGWETVSHVYRRVHWKETIQLSISYHLNQNTKKQS